MIKKANIIIIGGPIAVGKSTLAKALNIPCIDELDPEDELQNILLKKMYEKHEFAAQIFQLDLMMSRFEKYKNIAKSNKLHIFDRFILEDKLFAEMHLKKDQPVLEYYLNIWNDKINEVINEIGLPKIYILLTCSWETFKKRIFIRNRKSEIENFDANEKFFHEILDIYEIYMKKKFKKYNIPHFIVDTNNISKLELVKIIKNELLKRDIK